MLSTIFDIDKTGNVLLQDNSIALVPAMWEVYKNKYMGSNMIRYIASMYDYRSPFRELPEDRRAKHVVKAVWKDKKATHLNDPLVLKAIEEFKELQYDPDIEAYQVMTKKSHEINQVYNTLKITADNLEDANVIQKKMTEAAKSRIELLDIIKKSKDSDKQVYGKGKNTQYSLMEQNLNKQ